MEYDIDELRVILTTLEDMIVEAHETLNEVQLDSFERIMIKIVEMISSHVEV